MLLARNVFCSNVTFVNRFVRQHWLTNDVTDSIDICYVSFHLLVDVDKATLVNGYTSFFSID